MKIWIDIAGETHRVELSEALLAAARGESVLSEEATCAVDGSAIVVDARIVQSGVLSLIVAAEDGVRRQLRCVLDGDSVLVAGERFAVAESDPRSLQARAGAGAAAGGAKAVKAPMPGRVVRLLAGVGDEVTEGQGLLVIEAMKMQNELRSPKAGRVVEVSVAVGDTVASGVVLVVVGER